MKVLQTYETTILSESSKHALHALIVPRRSFAGENRGIKVDDVLSSLGLQRLMVPSIEASDLVNALAVLLSPSVDYTKKTAYLVSVLQDTPLGVTPPTTPTDRTFAEQAVFDSLLPFEQSPLSLESLGKLVVSASGAGIGAYAGFVLAGPTPLLLITIPAGMIICGAAKGIADALEQGLRDRLVRFLRDHPKTVESSCEEDLEDDSA